MVLRDFLLEIDGNSLMLRKRVWDDGYQNKNENRPNAGAVIRCYDLHQVLAVLLLSCLILRR